MFIADRFGSAFFFRTGNSTSTWPNCLKLRAGLALYLHFHLVLLISYFEKRLNQKISMGSSLSDDARCKDDNKSDK
jgi:hypothetical protein